MIWTVTRGEVIFPITDGVGRVYRTAGKLGMQMGQTTQVVQRMRAAWPTAFPDRALRVLKFDIPVTFPPCTSLEEAAAQAQDIALQCPPGGVLTGQYGATLRTYSQAWIDSITSENIGLTNFFTFAISAINPTTATLSKLAQMNSQYIANMPAITGLTGGGSSKLDSYVTTDVAVGFTMLATPTIGGIAQAIHFRLTAGTDATQTDPTAGPLIVRPLDYDAGTNAKVWKAI